MVQFKKTFKNSCDNFELSGRKVKNLEDYYSDPIPSSYLDITCSDVSDASMDEVSTWNVESIKCKLWAVTDINNKKVFFPLLHTLKKEEEEADHFA